MLLGDEPDQLRMHHGAQSVVWDVEEEELRTRVVDGRCVFLGESGCSIHDKPYYPKVCRGFPWRFAESDEPYGYDLDICPELQNET